MTETGRTNTGAGLLLAQGVGLSTDLNQGHVLAHAQRGTSI